RQGGAGKPRAVAGGPAQGRPGRERARRAGAGRARRGGARRGLCDRRPGFAGRRGGRGPSRGQPPADPVPRSRSGRIGASRCRELPRLPRLRRGAGDLRPPRVRDGRVTGWLTPDEWSVVALSLRVSLLAVALTLPLAYALAWLLARRRFPGAILLDALVHLPLVVPPVVTGWLLLVLFGRTGPIGAWLEAQFGIVLVFRWTGAALAAAVMALPLMVRAMRLSIEAVDRRLVEAARTLGARPWRAFATITLPLSLPGIAAGAMLGFARSLGEFGATIT